MAIFDLQKSQAMLLYASFAALFLAVISFYFNWKSNRTTIYLSICLFAMGFQGITHSLYLTREPSILLAIFFNNFSVIYFIPGAFLFFYVRGTLLDKTTIEWKDSWHFIPALVILISILPYWFTPFSYKMDIVQKICYNQDAMKNIQLNWLVPSAISLIGRCVLFISYPIYCIYIIYRYKKDNFLKELRSPQTKLMFRWLYVLSYSVLLIAFSVLMITIFYAFPSLNPEKTFAFTSFMSIFCEITFIFLALSLVVFPQILYGIPTQRNYSPQGNPQNIPATEGHPINLPIEKDTLEDSTEEDVKEEDLTQFRLLGEKVLQYMHEEKPYLNPNFSIDDLARALNAPRHHFYYCLNKVLNIKFTDLRRQLRIAHAQKLLEEGKHETMSMEGIGFESGFTSRSNFFSAFKSELGLTPTEFLEKMKK